MVEERERTLAHGASGGRWKGDLSECLLGFVRSLMIREKQGRFLNRSPAAPALIVALPLVCEAGSTGDNPGRRNNRERILRMKQDVATIHPVVMSGGAGSRLWPLSRRLLSQAAPAARRDAEPDPDTVARFAGAEFAPPILICNEEHRFHRRADAQAGPRSRGDRARPRRAQPRPGRSNCRDDGGEKRRRRDRPAGAVRFTSIRGRAARSGRQRTPPSPPPHATARWSPSGSSRARRKRVMAISRAAMRSSKRPAASRRALHREARPVDGGEMSGSGDFFWNSGMFLFKASTLLAEMRRLDR